MNKPLLSIVVPTKNRYKYLKYLISFFTTLRYPELELVVQDNSDDNSAIVDFLKTITDERVKYFYRPEHLTINQNSDAAVLNSTGEYVCYMGDDDLFAPNVLTAVKLMQQHDAQAAVFSIPVFVWPDCKGTKFWDTYVPYKIPKYTGNVTILDSEKELINTLKLGGFIMNNLPKVYHGIVIRKSLDDVYHKYGSFFPGPSPDMANAVALALQGLKILRIDYPFLIGGTGHVRIQGNEKGDNQKSFKNLSFLDSDTEKNWDKRVPKIWTGQTIYMETMLKVLEKSGHTEYDKYMNFYHCYVPFMKNHRQDAKMVFDVIKFPQHIVLFYYIIVLGMVYFMNKYKRKRKENASILTISKEIPDIVQYVDKVMEYNSDVVIQ